MGTFQENHATGMNRFSKEPSAKAKLLSGLIWMIVPVYPVAALFSKYANDVCFYLLVILGVYAIFLNKKDDSNKSFSPLLKMYWPLWLTMCLFFLGELLNQLFVSGFRISRLALPFRFVLLPVLVYGFLIFPLEKLKKIEWGLALGGVLAGVFVFIISDMGAIRAQTWDYVGIWLIPFANLTVLVGFLAVLTIGWDDGKNMVSVIFRILALFSAIYAAYLSESRASWIAVLFLGIIVSGLFFKTYKKTVLATCVAVLAIAFSLSFLSGSKLNARINQMQANLVQYQDDTNRNTSIGIRFQLYRTSWQIFTENPWFGMNRKNASFNDEINKRTESGIISPVAAKQPHAHNEFLQRLVQYGILGGVAVLFIFLVPFLYFFRHVRSDDRALKTIAYMGITFNIGFLIFGLSDVIYEWRNTVQFYIVMLSILLALLIKRKAEINYLK